MKGYTATKANTSFLKSNEEITLEVIGRPSSLHQPTSIVIPNLWGKWWPLMSNNYLFKNPSKKFRVQSKSHGDVFMYGSLFETPGVLHFSSKQIHIYTLCMIKATHTYNDWLRIYAAVKSQGNSAVRTEQAFLFCNYWLDTVHSRESMGG